MTHHAPVLVPNVSSTLSAINTKLGLLSEKYESRGAGTVSSGKGDYGGVSYGNWQLATKMNRPQEFLKNEGAAWADEFTDQIPGSKEFSATWISIAKKESDKFKEAQHAYIKRTHFDVTKSNIKTNLGIDIDLRSSVLQDVVWSTAVQHGPDNRIFERALKGKDVKSLTDSDIIKLVYQERGRKRDDGKLVYFSKNSSEIQLSVSDRFNKESRDALNSLEK